MEQDVPTLMTFNDLNALPRIRYTLSGNPNIRSFDPEEKAFFNFRRDGDRAGTTIGEQNSDSVRPSLPFNGGAQQAVHPGALSGNGGLRVTHQYTR